MTRWLKIVLKKVILSKFLASVLMKSVMRLHSFAYTLSGMYATIANDGVHPKHRIVNYKDWFLQHIENDWVVVDIGSNNGVLSSSLAEKVCQVYSIEIVRGLYEEAVAKRSRSNISYICADASVYDYSSCEPVNCIVLSNVLEHIEYRVDFLRKINMAVKWCNPDRRMFLIRVPLIDRDWITLFKKEMGLEWRLDVTHYIEYTIETFQDEVNRSGLVVESFDVRFGELYAVCCHKGDVA